MTTEQNQDQQEAPVADGAADLPAGELLRQAREARGESVADVARALKLTLRQVEAMESGRFDLLPGAAFARGFMRNYARHLHIDIDAALARLHFDGEEESAKLTPVANAAGVMPDGEEERKAYGPIAMTVALLMLLVFFLAWYFDGFKVTENHPAAPEQPAPESEQSDSAWPSRQIHEPVAVPPAQEEPLLPADAGLQADAESAADEETAAPAAVSADIPAAMPDVAEAVAAAAATLPAVAPTVPGNATDDAAAQGGQLVFNLKDASSWIQVRDSKGVMLYSGTDAKGTMRKVQGTPPFSVVVGNAANVALEFNGQPVDMTAHIQGSGVARLTVQ